MKKTLAVLLAGVIGVSVFAFAGCKKETGKDTIQGGTGENGTLNISCKEAGYGLDWLKNIARAYSEKYDVTVNVYSSVNSSEVITKADSRQSEYDIIMTVGSQFKLADGGDLVDLSDVYNATPEGESKTIAEKMNPYYYQQLLRDDGTIYTMNWVNALDGIFYNKTMLDKYVPGWEMPNTTDELKELCNDVKATGQYAFSATSGTNYWDYVIYVWAAQYCGVDTYFDYFNITYRDEDGTAHKAETSYTQLSAAIEGREKAVDYAAEILNMDNGYVHQQAKSMNYLQAQVAFAGNGYRSDKTECAFIVSGDWMEFELSQYLAKNPQDIGLMRTPILSSIVETLDNTAMTDAELSQLVSFIDAGKTYEEVKAESGWGTLTEKDYNKVRDARNIACTATMDHMVSIPVTCQNIEGGEQKLDNAKKFLIFMASDEAGEIYANTLDGRSLIYGYTPDTSDVSYFTQTVLDFGAYTPVYVDYSSPYVYNGGLRYVAVNERYLNLMNGQTADSVNAAMTKHWTDNWQTIVNAGLSE